MPSEERPTEDASRPRTGEPKPKASGRAGSYQGAGPEVLTSDRPCARLTNPAGNSHPSIKQLLRNSDDSTIRQDLPVLAHARGAGRRERARRPRAGPEKVASVEGITEYRLDNGLRVLLFPDPTRPKVTVNLTVLVGSRHEGYGETGMAHLLEHMVFKGTPTHPDIPGA